MAALMVSRLVDSEASGLFRLSGFLKKPGKPGKPGTEKPTRNEAGTKPGTAQTAANPHRNRLSLENEPDALWQTRNKPGMKPGKRKPGTNPERPGKRGEK